MSFSYGITERVTDSQNLSSLGSQFFTANNTPTYSQNGQYPKKHLSEMRPTSVQRHIIDGNSYLTATAPMLGLQQSQEIAPKEPENKTERIDSSFSFNSGIINPREKYYKQEKVNNISTNEFCATEPKSNFERNYDDPYNIYGNSCLGQADPLEDVVEINIERNNNKEKEKEDTMYMGMDQRPIIKFTKALNDQDDEIKALEEMVASSKLEIANLDTKFNDVFDILQKKGFTMEDVVSYTLTAALDDEENLFKNGKKNASILKNLTSSNYKKEQSLQEVANELMLQKNASPYSVSPDLSGFSISAPGCVSLAKRLSFQSVTEVNPHMLSLIFLFRNYLGEYVNSSLEIKKSLDNFDISVTFEKISTNSATSEKFHHLDFEKFLVRNKYDNYNMFLGPPDPYMSKILLNQQHTSKNLIKANLPISHVLMGVPDPNIRGILSLSASYLMPKTQVTSAQKVSTYVTEFSPSKNTIVFSVPFYDINSLYKICCNAEVNPVDDNGKPIIRKKNILESPEEEYIVTFSFNWSGIQKTHQIAFKRPAITNMQVVYSTHKLFTRHINDILQNNNDRITKSAISFLKTKNNDTINNNSQDFNMLSQVSIGSSYTKLKLVLDFARQVKILEWFSKQGLPSEKRPRNIRFNNLESSSSSINKVNEKLKIAGSGNFINIGMFPPLTTLSFQVDYSSQYIITHKSVRWYIGFVNLDLLTESHIFRLLSYNEEQKAYEDILIKNFHEFLTSGMWMCCDKFDLSVISKPTFITRYEQQCTAHGLNILKKDEQPIIISSNNKKEFAEIQNDIAKYGGSSNNNVNSLSIPSYSNIDLKNKGNSRDEVYNCNNPKTCLTSFDLNEKRQLKLFNISSNYTSFDDMVTKKALNNQNIEPLFSFIFDKRQRSPKDFLYGQENGKQIKIPIQNKTTDQLALSTSVYLETSVGRWFLFDLTNARNIGIVFVSEYEGTNLYVPYPSLKM